MKDSPRTSGSRFALTIRDKQSSDAVARNTVLPKSTRVDMCFRRVDASRPLKFVVKYGYALEENRDCPVFNRAMTHRSRFLR